MSNVKNTKNLNNVNNAIMHKLDIKDRNSIDNVLVKLDVIDNFNQIITDYVDFKEVESGKNTNDNILLTYFEIKRNKQSVLTLLYETKSKLDEIKNILQDLIDE